jgi:hypothetical protein
MRYLKVKKTARVDETPTAPSWIVAALAELEEQRARLVAGVACLTCRGAGTLATSGRAGVTWTACPGCDGSGCKK